MTVADAQLCSGMWVTELAIWKLISTGWFAVTGSVSGSLYESLPMGKVTVFDPLKVRSVGVAVGTAPDD
jgi:hypothetical protein